MLCQGQSLPRQAGPRSSSTLKAEYMPVTNAVQLIESWRLQFSCGFLLSPNKRDLTCQPRTDLECCTTSCHCNMRCTDVLQLACLGLASPSSPAAGSNRTEKSLKVSCLIQSSGKTLPARTNVSSLLTSSKAFWQRSQFEQMSCRVCSSQSQTT